MTRLAWCLALSSLLALAGCSAWPMGPDTEEGVRLCHVRSSPRLERTITVPPWGVVDHLAHGYWLGGCEAAMLCTPRLASGGEAQDAISNSAASRARRPKFCTAQIRSRDMPTA